jgi:chorismate mutase
MKLPPSLKERAQSLLADITAALDAKAERERVGYESQPLAMIRDRETSPELLRVERALMIALDGDAFEKVLS